MHPKTSLLTLTLVVALTALAAPPASAQEQESLYARLGGYDAIAAVTDEFVGRLVTDDALGKYFVGLSDDSKARIRQLVVDQLCEATGGPCLYIGRDMETAHAGLGITEAEWQVGVDHLVATLDQFQVGEPERGELLDLLSSLKGDIVQGM